MSRAGDAVIDMRYFGAAHNPVEFVTSRVNEADVYVGIIGSNYGSSVPERPERSFTELEFDAATEYGLPRLVFLIDERALPPDNEPPALSGRQRAFRRRLLESGVSVAQVSSPDELEVRLFQALLEADWVPHRAPPARRPWQAFAEGVGGALDLFGVTRGRRVEPPSFPRVLDEHVQRRSDDRGTNPRNEGGRG